jgi:hypothetical protein
VGYDQHTIFDIGFSCRFFRESNNSCFVCRVKVD